MRQGAGGLRVRALQERLDLCEDVPAAAAEARVQVKADEVKIKEMKRYAPFAGIMSRPTVAEGAKREDRVVLRLRPYATFCTPPRHVSSPADLPTLTHETSASIAW